MVTESIGMIENSYAFKIMWCIRINWMLSLSFSFTFKIIIDVDETIPMIFVSRLNDSSDHDCRGRRMRNNVNIGLGTGGAIIETGQNPDSRPSSTDSCKSNSNVDPNNSLSFKDYLVQFAKLSQLQGILIFKKASSILQTLNLNHSIRNSFFLY